MITKWKLFNFKSVRDETDLDLAPLTIFAGTNSSGKSTVLQSMLLFAQTLSSRAITRPIVLNGDIVHMGQMEDILSHGSENEQITIGCELSVSRDNHPYVRKLIERANPWQMEYDTFPNVKHVRCEVSFDIDPGSLSESRQSQPRLYGSVVEVTNEYEELTLAALRGHGPARTWLNETKLYASLASTESVLSKMRHLVTADRATSQRELHYDVRIGDEPRMLTPFAGTLDADRKEEVGCSFSHFLPSRLIQRIPHTAFRLFETAFANLLSAPRDDAARNAMQQISIEDWDSFRQRRDSTKEIGSFVDSLERLISLWPSDDDPLPLTLEERLTVWSVVQEHVKEWMVTVDQEQRGRKTNVDMSRHRLHRNAGDTSTNCALAIMRTLETHDRFAYSLANESLPSSLDAAATVLNATFTELVRYLGPLRDAPKPVYPNVSSVAPNDVGYRGEHTAAVLEQNGETQVEYYAPSIFDTPNALSRTSVRTLHSAVEDWLSYLGVAETVQTRDLGKYGYEMKVQDDPNSRPLDLTHVGVGVSQVLPILVMCLLADSDSTVILEQPELHLHPAVQARLGDFLLATALGGVQCIVETHSEHLINRLRLRMAKAPATNPYTDKARVYFVEKKGGCSQFRPIEINEYGAIVKWPDGFFDQAQLEAEEILLAGLAKREQARKKNRGSVS